MKKLTILTTVLLLACLLLSCSSNENDNLQKQKELRKGYKELKIYAYFDELGELNKDNELLYEQYEFDDDGNIVLELKHDRKTGEFFETSYKYNEANLFTEINRLDVDGKVVYSETREYHEGDTIIAKRVYYIHDDRYYYLISADKHEHIYDDKGNEIAYYCYDKSDYQTVTEYAMTENIYDDKNELTQTITIIHSGELDPNKKAVFGKPDTIITKYENGFGFKTDKDGELTYIGSQDWLYGKTYDEEQLFPSPSDLTKYKYNKDG
jgi:hypothetical protein